MRWLFGLFRGCNMALYQRAFPGVPFCQSFVRRVRAFMQAAYGEVGAGEIVLDLGCGRGQQFLDYGAGPYVVGADISVTNLRRNDCVHGRVCCDFNRLPFRSGCFRRIVTMDVIEHVRGPHFGCAEMARVLAEGGRVLIGTPNLLSPKGLFIKFLPRPIGRAIWQILRGSSLPYPHYYEANTVGRLRRLLGPRLRLVEVLRQEEDPLWLIDLPVFAPALLYVVVMNRLRACARWRSYIACVFQSERVGL